MLLEKISGEKKNKKIIDPDAIGQVPACSVNSLESQNQYQKHLRKKYTFKGRIWTFYSKDISSKRLTVNICVSVNLHQDLRICSIGQILLIHYSLKATMKTKDQLFLSYWQNIISTATKYDESSATFVHRSYYLSRNLKVIFRFGRV